MESINCTEQYMNMQGVKICGYRNLWSAIDDEVRNGTRYYLMENDTWGDETCGLIVTAPEPPHEICLKSGKTVPYIPGTCVVCETYDDITTALDDCL